MSTLRTRARRTRAIGGSVRLATRPGAPSPSNANARQVPGERDPIASIARADRNGHNLPAATSRIVLHGASHSQFGDDGFQPGDRFATIPRVAQRARTAAVLLDALARPETTHTEEPAP
jgi:hypothetical protein